MRSNAPFLLLASTYISTAWATYTLATDYTGTNFFNGFEFFTQPDPTDGHVQFLDENAANATSLAGFINGGNSSLAVYLGVNSASEAPNGRDSIRISSTQSFHHGLIIADIAHMPTGCGTWPAFWMVGQAWPTDGEIDIVEGVNLQPTNAMTLHTDAGVIISGDSDNDFSGALQTANCDVDAPDQAQNAGCQILDQSNLTFGSSFNDLGGGVFATEWTSSFIKIWFFPRTSIPSDIVASQPDPSNAWGTPNSLFQGNFSMDEHFTNLSIVFDTTFCGQWAGNVWNQTAECAALAPTCEQYVTETPQAFKETFWAVNSLQVYQDDGDATVGSDGDGAGNATSGVKRMGRRRRGASGGFGAVD